MKETLHTLGKSGYDGYKPRKAFVDIMAATDEFGHDEAWDAIAANVNIDEEMLIARVKSSSGSPSQQVSVLTSRIQQLNEQVRRSL